MDDFHYPSKVYFRLSPIPPSPSPSLTAPPAIRHVSLAIPWISAHLRGSFLHFYSVASLWFCTLSLTNLRLSLTWLTGNRNAFFCNLTFEMHCKRTCARVLDDDAYHSSTHPWRYRGSSATSKSVTIAQYCWYFWDCLSTAAKNMHMHYFRCTFIGSHWWCVGGQALRWKLRTPTTVHANRFHVAVCLFSNRSQSGRQNVIRASDTQMRLVCHFFFNHILTSGLWSITEETHSNMESICMHRRW